MPRHQAKCQSSPVWLTASQLSKFEMVLRAFGARRWKPRMSTRSCPMWSSGRCDSASKNGDSHSRSLGEKWCQNMMPGCFVLPSARCIMGKRGKSVGIVQPRAVQASKSAAIAFARESPTAEKQLGGDGLIFGTWKVSTLYGLQLTTTDQMIKKWSNQAFSGHSFSLQVGQIDSRPQVLSAQEALGKHRTDWRVASGQIAAQRHWCVVPQPTEFLMISVLFLLTPFQHQSPWVLGFEAFRWGSWNHGHDHQMCAVPVQGRRLFTAFGIPPAL